MGIKFSCIKKGKKEEPKKKKSSKKAQMNEEFQTACTKLDGFYMKLHSINSELKGITEHKALIINPDERHKFIIGDFKEQISYIIETVNRLEDICGLEQLEFDVNRIWPKEFIKRIKCLILILT